MKGKLFGIGAGPGDPELLTIKAVNTIKKCDVIAVPVTGSGAASSERTAYSIAENYLAGKELLECRFTMETDITKRKEARQQAAAGIMRFLDEEKDVGFITLGDPTTYSTYMYVHELIISKGFDAEIIPGISSYAAAAAAFGIALCEGSEILTIIPASHHANIGELLDLPGNKVIMKSGGNLAQVLEKLKERSYGERVKIAYRCTMEGQKLYYSIDEFVAYQAQSPCAEEHRNGYFTIAIVRG